MKKKKKSKLPAWRRSRDPNDRLIVAADNWVKAHGGSAVIMGPVSVMTFPGEREADYYVVVKCLGKRPVKSPSPTEADK